MRIEGLACWTGHPQRCEALRGPELLMTRRKDVQPRYIPAPALVFDFGGVLLDWNPRHLYLKLFNGDRVATERFLTEIDFYAWNLLQDAGRPMAEGVAELSARFPHYAQLIRAYHERWEESIAGPIQASVDILHELKRRRYALYGLSNYGVETFQRVRHDHPFLECFDAVVLSGELGLVKPDPRIYLAFLQRVGRKAEECVFIDDSQPNVAAARQLGFDGIRFESAAQLRQELFERGLLAVGAIRGEP